MTDHTTSNPPNPKDPGFRLENYTRKTTFSGFLPGISGINGIPIWCCYVNRGQGIASFGVADKDHAMMEFYPAHQAYQNVSRLGFRTFVRKNGRYAELLNDPHQPHAMTIYRNRLEITGHHREAGLAVKVTYYTLPGESFGGLVRQVTITNTGAEKAGLEVLDGMPALVPYGVDMASLKNMGQTVKAWMRVEKTAGGLPYFRVRASIQDTAAVSEVRGGNFGYAVTADGEPMSWLADPERVFSYDTSLQTAEGFKAHGLAELHRQEAMSENIFPCCFFGAATTLPAGGEMTFFELFGQTEEPELLQAFLKNKPGRNYFTDKAAAAGRLTDGLCQVIATKTDHPAFDEYCRYTYMDNVLRGGVPVMLPGNKIFYVYSRKHGDLERDYNYFRMLPEFYSQGNGNFRDVCQNRRMDNFFTPIVGRENIRKFYSLIQLDGCNPLMVEKVAYRLTEEAAETILDPLTQEQKEILLQSLALPFTPGSLCKKLREVLPVGEAELYFTKIMAAAEEEGNAEFGEGYWSDHWTYNLDLAEAYLSLYPEREEELLLAEDCPYFRGQRVILPRRQRYVKTDRGIRQHYFLEEVPEAENIGKTSESGGADGTGRSGEICGADGTGKNGDIGGSKWLRAKYGKGPVIKVSLLEKLLVLCGTKYAALDAYGMGVEMEGGKPGWYDALNGLPGLFGSSVAETCELSRMLHFTLRALSRCPDEIMITGEVLDLLQAMEQITKECREEIFGREVLDGKEALGRGEIFGEEEDIGRKEALGREEAFGKKKIFNCGEVLNFWERRNIYKENYWQTIAKGISGEKTAVSTAAIKHILTHLKEVTDYGIRKAKARSGAVCPTYFAYEITDYTEGQNGIKPLHFEVIPLPYFLEGAVRYLKLPGKTAEKEQLAAAVRESGLYDRKLKMYKVNASLQNASYELGRAKAFTPGWLENESVWLHMEYKYLLALLKSGLYQRYLTDFTGAAIPFLNPEVYGRSIYENSSFIASSANPNRAVHGKGFVARLSGSTVEFLEMWKIMMFGDQLFREENGEISLAFRPCIPRILIGAERRIETVFMGRTKFICGFAEQKDYIPGEYEVAEIRLIYDDESTYTIKQEVLGHSFASDIRDGKVKEISISLH